VDETRQIKQTVRTIAARYPDLPGNRAGDFAHPRAEVTLERTAFDLSLIADILQRPTATVLDVGGGLGLFASCAAALGARSLLMDDLKWLLGDPKHRQFYDVLQQLWSELGVELVSRDVIRDGLGDDVGDIDAVTQFHFMEHAHASPKGLFHAEVDRLRPGGRFVIAVPNCSNLRKRITTPIGKTKWSPMDEWYDEPAFHGHVREPDVDDLMYIARDLGLENVSVVGRNFLGLANPAMGRRLAAQATDKVLRRRPSLCSDIYLVGDKPTRERSEAA
jgi:SAM-dependent methyltransferase